MMKPAPERAYDLEERLNEIRHRLARFIFDGVTLSSAEVQALVGDLQEAKEEAFVMRCELSRQRWNDRKAADPLVEVVIEEAGRPGTNLVFFPVAARKIPAGAPQLGDGGPDGGKGGAA
jgi:hypothetical protein